MSVNYQKTSVKDHYSKIFPDGSWQVSEKTFLGYVEKASGCEKNVAEAQKKIKAWERSH